MNAFLYSDSLLIFEMCCILKIKISSGYWVPFRSLQTPQVFRMVILKKLDPIWEFLLLQQAAPTLMEWYWLPWITPARNWTNQTYVYILR